MLILASIFVMLAVTLVPTVRSTLSQRRQINDLRSQVAQQGQTVTALRQQERQWSDPAYVEQQARERLKFVRVGETSYTVIDAEPAPAATGGPKMATPTQSSTANSPWYGQLWQSMVIADASANTPAKAPSTVAPPAKSKPSASPSSTR